MYTYTYIILGRTSLQSAKSGAGEQSPTKDCRERDSYDNDNNNNDNTDNKGQ